MCPGSQAWVVHREPGGCAWLLLFLAAGPAVGWLVGDLSIRPADPGLDAEPLLGVWAGLEDEAGVLLVAGGAGAIAVLAVLARRGELPAGWGVLSAALRVWRAPRERPTGSGLLASAAPISVGGLLVMAFPVVIALAVLLAVGATRQVRGCSWPAAAGWVSGGALTVVGLLVAAAEATGQLDGGDAAGLRLTLLSYVFPAKTLLPEPEQSAPWSLLVAGTAQWALFNLVGAGALAALDRPEPLPDRI